MLNRSIPDASKDLVDELVHQFTDPYACYRELIQNSIDAGSTRIEVTLTYRPERGGGLMTSTVQDWGEGMNRRIIEDYLITKFRSSKENDLTKIGKYGIGFVSVFALQPDAVAVDTGRDGESWRVLFKQDRSYELLKMAEPFEGTRVVLHRRCSGAEYEAHVEKARDALGRWCRHSEVDVTFAAGGSDGSAPHGPVTVHEPVKVDAPYQVEHRDEGLVVVVGIAREAPAQSGFYNRGLTLLETDEEFIPGVAVKIVSRALEHTLTRDNVRRDESFWRVLGIAKKLADGPLMKQLPDELQKAAAQPGGDGHDWRTLFQYARARLPRSALTLRAPGGGAQAAKDVKQLVIAADPTPVALRLVSSGTVVVESQNIGPLADALRELFRQPELLGADDDFTYAEPPTTQAPDGFAAALTELLAGAGCPVAGVAIAEVRGAGADGTHVFIDAVGRPLAADRAGMRLVRKRQHPILCLNKAHPKVAKIDALMHRAPRLAALLLARRMLVRFELLDEETDAYLTGWALS